jgi:hypothetical protein
MAVDKDRGARFWATLKRGFGVGRLWELAAARCMRPSRLSFVWASTCAAFAAILVLFHP